MVFLCMIQMVMQLFYNYNIYMDNLKLSKRNNDELDFFIENITISFNIEISSSEVCVNYLDYKIILLLSNSESDTENVYIDAYYKSLILSFKNQSYEYYNNDIEAKIIEKLKWKNVSLKELNSVLKEIFDLIPNDFPNKWVEID